MAVGTACAGDMEADALLAYETTKSGFLFFVFRNHKMKSFINYPICYNRQ